MSFKSWYPIVCDDCMNVVAELDFLDLVQKQHLFMECPNCKQDTIELLRRGGIQICPSCKEGCTPFDQYQILEGMMSVIYDAYMDGLLDDQPSAEDVLEISTRSDTGTVTQVWTADDPINIMLCCNRYWEECDCTEPLSWEDVLPKLTEALVDFAYEGDTAQWIVDSKYAGCDTCTFKATQFCQPLRSWLSKHFDALDRIVKFDIGRAEYETNIRLERYNIKRPVPRIDSCGQYFPDSF